MFTPPNLAPYACHPSETRGRLYSEPESPTRTCFQRDRDRIIHSSAFRRLQYKTQVFVNHEGDFFRTRLTHSLEVAQIARSACRWLGLNEDMGEALALGHDLGHPPFGHAGEYALDEMMAPFGGFDHNAQSLRVVTDLEHCFAQFDGLNLSWEVLEGVVKHNGPLIGPNAREATAREGVVFNTAVPGGILNFMKVFDLEIGTYASAEAQCASLADDIAYNNHDIDDGLRAKLFTVNDLMDLPLVGEIFYDVHKEFPDISEARRIHEAVRRMIGAMVTDVLRETERRIKDAAPKTAQDIRDLGQPVVAFSDSMAEHEATLKAFLFDNMYRHYKLNRMSTKAKRVVKDLFQLLVAEPNCLPTDWRRKAGDPGSTQTAQLVADYIAGITDRLALDEHRKLFDVQARTS